MSDEITHEAVEFDLKLRIGPEVLRSKGQVSTAPIRVADFLPILHSVSGAIEGAALRRLEREGKRLSCRPGCGACCRQLVPVSTAEAVRLEEIVAEMPDERRREIRRRFEEALEKLAERGLLERLRRLTRTDDPAVRHAFGLEYMHLKIACPFLEDEQCGIHPLRPLSCREHLVTSPREYCEDPRPGQVEMVKLAQKLTYLLFRFGDGTGEDDARWVPMILALEWADAERDDPQPRFPGKALFENFVRKLAAGLEMAKE